MPRIALIVAGVLAAGVLAGCGALGSQGVGSPTPKTVVGTVAAQTFPIVPAFHVTGDPANGKTLFVGNCGGCHTLKDAGTNGTVGPNLDQLKPDYQAATAQVWNGGGQMPAYGSSGQFTKQQVADVAAYVVTSTGGTLP